MMKTNYLLDMFYQGKIKFEDYTVLKAFKHRIQVLSELDLAGSSELPF